MTKVTTFNYVFINLNTHVRAQITICHLDKYAIDNGEERLKQLIKDYDVTMDTVTFRKQEVSKIGMK